MHPNNINKSLEWVGARSAGGCARTEAKPSNKTVTPSDRELILGQSTKRIEEQAADAKLATERAIGSMIKQSHEVVNNSDKNRNPHTTELIRIYLLINCHCPLTVV